MLSGRTAYLAGYHAAQALIFKRHSRVFKTHRGVHSEFGRLVKDDPLFDVDDRAFLGHTYSLKAIADYDVGAAANVSNPEAASAITGARRLVEKIEQTIHS
jgi:uncharacterized protein (UPF0332 family)